MIATQSIVVRRFVGLGSNPRARVRLFCLPFAGGAASAFRGWRVAQPPDLEIVAVELPGRERRIAEAPLGAVDPLMRDIADALPMDRPFALFGHSMGALLIFELARILARRNAPLRHLFVSAFRAPHLPKRTLTRHLLDDEALLEEIKKMDGTPQEILEHDELLAMMLPLLRKDFAVVETYSHVPARPLEYPITAFGGVDDDDVTEAELHEWRAHTCARFRLEMMPGHHFYLYGATAHLLNSISNDLGLSASNAGILE